MVSVIIPFYSRVDWLEEAIVSVLTQTYQDFEIIVINDGSREDVSSLLEKYGARITYLFTENKGPAHARNFGISNANGKYVAFLDSDDLWLPKKLELQVKLMNENKLVWSHTNYFIFQDGQEYKLKPFNNYGFEGDIFPGSLTKLNIATPCVMVLRSKFDEFDFLRFSENMRYGQDGYLWMLLSVNNSLGYIEEPLVSVRRTGGNAVQRAYVHLSVKANLYQHLILKFSSFYPDKKINPMVSLLYSYCYSIHRIVDSLYVQRSISSNTRENISKVLYSPVYLLFKLF